MPTSNARKGAETERMVAAYLREQEFWMADRRLREGRHDDQGDIDGVPFTTIQVKYVAQPALQAWAAATLKQRDTAGTPLCLLVVRAPNKPPAQWHAYMPGHQISGTGPSRDLEGEAWTWVRMDLRAAVVHLHMLVNVEHLSRSSQSLSTTSDTRSTTSVGRPSVPSTESGPTASPTTWTKVCSSALPAMPEAPPST